HERRDSGTAGPFETEKPGRQARIIAQRGAGRSNGPFDQGFQPSYSVEQSDQHGQDRVRPVQAEQERCLYGSSSVPCSCRLRRSSCCLRHPYGVKPRGLYTLSTVITSNTSKPTPG